ncbi:MAG: fibronectin type III domain-containing protein [Sphingobacteriales bacterium]|nr:MAG: fibronectin type III domain-containing protein [Sphingobacteriales bacterium]
MRRLLLFIALTFVFTLGTQAQSERTCAAMDVLSEQLANDPSLQGKMEAIERHYEDFIESGAHLHDRVVVTIPVVFHIIHNGDAVGSNENISDALIMAQLNQLNLDFRKLNSDASLVPSLFAGVAADAEIQFCLAQRTPAGAATTGINRVYYNQSAPTTSYMNNTVKPATIWDRSKYLNIWTANLSGGILGYAQFPGGSASTDGVVCLHSSVGSVANPNPAGGVYGKGRTATHEVGHWLNLRHIWGDATCGNDQVSDTPVHNTANYGCPSYPHYSTCSGSPVEMTMNYMDYTDDACMYMYTTGQKSRMQAVLAAGGSRASLATSNGCTPPSGTSCGTPGSLSASGVSQTGATLNWGTVSGATSYNVQYRQTGTSTWSNTTSTSTSAAVSGLTCNTGYEFQVRAVCGTTTGSYSGSATFTTSACGGTSCGTPGGLNATGITQTSATLNWAAVSGATSYNVRARQVGTTTWSTGTVTSTSVNFTGLTCNTNYEFQVQAVCGTTTGTYSGSANFTSSACSTTCTDTYESNNSQSAAKTIPKNTTISALIGSSTDSDWFKFTLTSTEKNIRVTLSNLPFDYDLRLYRNNTLLATSQNGGTANEVIIRNNTSTSGTYYIRVYGYNGAFSTTQCYNLLVETSATAFKLSSDAAELALEQTPVTFNVYPNPVSGIANIRLVQGTNDEPVNISVFDLTGRLVISQTANNTKEAGDFALDCTNLSDGIYIIRIETGQEAVSKKIIIQH